jgi:hypothetical protein
MSDIQKAYEILGRTLVKAHEKRHPAIIKAFKKEYNIKRKRRKPIRKTKLAEINPELSLGDQNGN